MRRNKRFIKGVVTLLIVAAVLQITSIFALQSSDENLEENYTDKILEPNTVDRDTITISDEAGQAIISTNGEGYADTYKDFLVELNVQSVYKDKIESLILNGYNLKNIMIAYEYLANEYGKSSWLDEFLQEQGAGQTWEQIFINYEETVGNFVPRNFEQEYLEELLNMDGITSDDVMIADRISYSLGVNFEDIINQRLQGLSFKQICMDEGIIGSAGTLPRVQITMEALKKYEKLGMKEDFIVAAYVLATKVNAQPEVVIDKLNQGISSEKIFEDYLVEKYNK